MSRAADTIAAIATPAGRGAIGIVRLSGPRCADIASAIAGRVTAPRYAQRVQFRDGSGRGIDGGLMILFPGPASYTGEDMLEMHCHGGTLVPTLLLQRALALGARPARPGEFTERAYLNGKLDLLQAEAVADLIDAQTERAARCAVRALEGEFSRYLEEHAAGLLELRVQVEAALDFPDEELDLSGRDALGMILESRLSGLRAFRANAAAGHALRQGLHVVLAGAPNAGKSSLLNRLVGSDRAIVDEAPGTTRDTIEADTEIAGMRIALVDTAGIRSTADTVEREGVRRSLAALEKADVVLVVHEPGAPRVPEELVPHLSPGRPVVFVRNKIDLVNESPAWNVLVDGVEVGVSARTGAGIELLQRAVASVGAGGSGETGEDVLLARTRHLHALDKCIDAAAAASSALREGASLELAAEELRVSLDALGSITGAVDAEDVLGRIFASFCIGK